VKMVKFVSVVSLFFVGGAAFAQGSESGIAGSIGLVAIGSALAMGLGALAAAGGQGRAAGQALEGLARNPGSKDAVFVPLLLSLAFMEFPALLSFLIAYLWLGK
jgi:F-type H+-transporting ATPase subunit c